MRFRQVHLDFHTSGLIPGIGKQFDKKQFQEALKAGHVDSITVFSKCHHGWAYHPSTANEQHPKLKFDLLGAELEAWTDRELRSMGATRLYLTADDAIPFWQHCGYSKTDEFCSNELEILTK